MIERLKCRIRGVLPLVYDDTLSYYEFLAKVIAKINELIDFMNNKLETKIVELVQEFFIDASYDEANEAIIINVER